jgi:uncharacterized membrane protein YgcG
MRLARLAAAALVAALASPVVAQEWIDYENRQDRFSINFPSQPQVENTEWTSSEGDVVPARRYTAIRGAAKYQVIVADFTGVESITTHRGAFIHAAHVARQREGGKVTFDGYAQIDRIEGHQLQITKDDGTRYFGAYHYEAKRLYIIEAWVPQGAPPPAAFQVAMSILDENGNNVRYNIDYDGSRTRAGGGGLGGRQGAGGGGQGGGGRGGQGGGGQQQ